MVKIKRIANNRFMLNELKQANPKWFSIENRRFFHDKTYMYMYSASGEPYLIRSTYAWSDMFGAKPMLRYRLNEVKGLEISCLLDSEFTSLSEVKQWLKNA